MPAARMRWGRCRANLLGTVLIAGSVLSARPAPAQEWVEPPPIVGGTLFKVPLLVRDFTYQDVPRHLLVTGEECEQVLVQDLLFSDFFDVQREGEVGTGRTSRSPEAIVWGKVQSRWGKTVLDGMLVDSETGKLIFEKSYSLGDPPDRWAIHAFSDDIVLYLTGESGVAGTRIAFVGNATGSKEIYLIDDGARLTRVTSLGSITISPSGSPDGKRLAFTSFVHGKPDLYWVEIGESKLRTLSDRPGVNSAPCWSPDGQHLVASLSFEGNSEIYKLDLSGKKVERLTFSPSIETSPTYSPVGNQIAFVSDRTGQTQIYIMDGDGANTRRLSFLNGMCDSPDWSRKGDRIVFVARVDPVYDIFTIRANGTDLRRLTAGEGNHENPRWAPDGRHLVFAMREGESRRLYIMAADGSGKRRLTWSRGDQYNPAWSPPLN
jgi:TolB protein